MSGQLAHDRRLSSLLELTRSALKQAKIEHMDALHATLRERGQVLAEMWGYDPHQGLPDVKPATSARRSPFAGVSPELVAEIRDTDRQLAAVMEHNLSKLRGERQLLNKSQRYMKDFQTLYGTQPESRYLDHVG